MTDWADALLVVILALGLDVVDRGAAPGLVSGGLDRKGAGRGRNRLHHSTRLPHALACLLAAAAVLGPVLIPDLAGDRFPPSLAGGPGRGGLQTPPGILEEVQAVETEGITRTAKHNMAGEGLSLDWDTLVARGKRQA